MILRAENDSLKSEFYRLQAELSKLVCPNCGGPPVPGGVSFDELRIENARLGEEVISSKFLLFLYVYCVVVRVRLHFTLNT